MDTPPPPRRRSSAINLWLVGGGIFAASACCCGGCIPEEPVEEQVAVELPYDPAWHDANGNPIEKDWKVDEAGNRAPAQQVFDANGKPIEFDANGNPVPPPNYVASTTTVTRTRTSHGLGWWPLMFVSRSGGYSGGSGSRPSSGATTGGSVSRGGFGSTGGAHAGGAVS